MNRHRKKAPIALLLLLCSSSFLFLGLGLTLKPRLSQAAAPSPNVAAIAVPFWLLLHGQSRQSSTPQATVPVTEPPATTVPETAPPDTSLPASAPPAPRYGEDESYFDDALFIGDSRTVQLSQYARLGKADYFAAEGMSVFRAFSTQASDRDFGSTDLSTLLCSRTYGKIYMMLGLNEAGYPLDSLIDTYEELIESVRSLQPEATIYLLQIYGVSKEKAAATDYLRPEHLQEINTAIAALADGEQVFCLDPRPIFEDENGYLLPEYSGDGVHAYGKYASLLSQWLCEQAG